MNLFVIPGNPPALYFYEEWKKEWLSHSPTHSFQISKYPDVEVKLDPQDFFRELSNAHTREFLKFSKEVNGPIVIIGHSLGSYFAQSISQQHPELVQKCIFIHPFLRKPERRAAIFLRGLRLARKWKGFEELILKNKKHLERVNPDLKYVTPDEASISLKLAYHEVKTIMRDASKVEIPSSLSDKYHLYYTQNDRWCTPSVIDQLKKQITALEVSTAHDFVRLKSERDVMSTHIRDLLNLNVT